ncbi:putative polyketide synthase 5 [Folsomia candida]|uniref:Putative polyketide synthase 5 n=1 Tax=Folsomia candida TaxID=158441 RepID=A0A226D5S6_FOLCA|nr:putative polyketide synthase 5 [Folsomia candida]
MNGTKQRSSIWVGGIRKVDDIPWVMETYKNEEVGHHNSAVFVGPAISFEECTKLEKIFDFVVTMAENEDPEACSFRLWDHVTFRFPPIGENSKTIPVSDAKLANNNSNNEPIAIIGMACRLPGSNDYNTFWNNLVKGADCIGKAPKDRFQPERDNPELIPEHGLTEAGYLSCPVDTFDAKFWGISPMELDYTDPQARMVLQLGWEALEDAGIPPSTIHGTDAGIFLGFWREDYNDLLLQSGSSAGNELRRYLGCSMGNAAARIAHVFGTTGPAIATETGCSSTICSIGAAMTALRNNSTGLAVAGGANLILKPFLYKEFQGVLSPSGRCKVFQSDADGFARAEGVIMYILKRETDARRDGNHIYAILSGYGTSQDGLSRSAGTPTIDGEARAMTLALKDADISPADVDWLEMHGTGTKVGDPIEVAATRIAYGLDAGRQVRKKPLIITSVKANIGHTESVSGAAGLLKVVMAMQHEEIPLQRITSALNPKLILDGLHIPLELLPWKGKYAGVSSFGITGTNSHLIVERASVTQDSRSQSDRISAYILPLSAKCSDAMAALKKRHVLALQNLNESQLADYCYTAAVCRDHFNEYRDAVVGFTTKDLIQAIVSGNNLEPPMPHKSNVKSKVCFLFPGQGCQYPGMGRGLYERCSIFRHHLDIMDDIAAKNYGLNLKALVFDGTGTTIYSQLCIFAVEYCLLKVWCAWGIVPSIVLGHSFGEFAASVAAGALSLPTALELLVTSRTKVFQNLEEGGMLVLKADENVTTNLINNFMKDVAEPDSWIDIAAVNSFEQTVISSTKEIIARFSIFSNKHGYKNTVLNVSHAFHSRSLEPILNQFESEAAQLNYPPRFRTVDYISSVYGRLINEYETIESNYWRKHMRQRVEFIGGAKSALQIGRELIFLEVGPHPVLCPLVSSIAEANTEISNRKVLLLPSMRKGADDIITMLDTAASLYSNGVNLDWSEIWASLTLAPPYKIPSFVPLYPFTTMEAFWFTSVPSVKSSHFLNSREIHPLLGSCLPTLVENNYAFINSTSRLLSKPITSDWLRDHKLGSHIIFPAAGYAEMAFAAVDTIKRINNKNTGMSKFGIELSDFQIQAALSLETNAEFYTRVQVSEEAEIYTISFLSRDPSSDVYDSQKLHATTIARVISPSVDESEAVDKNPIISTFDMATTREFENLYEEMKIVGYNFGRAFRTLNNIVYDKEATSFNSDVKIADNLLEAGYLMHPTIIDTLIQSSLLMMGNKITGFKLPVSIKSLRLYRPPRTMDKALLKIVGSGYSMRLVVATTHPDIHSNESTWTVVASITGLLTVSTTIKQLEKSLTKHIRNSLPIYIEEWRTSNELMDTQIDDLHNSSVRIPEPFKLSDDALVELQPLQDFILSRIVSTFSKLGWKWCIGSKVKATEVINELNLHEVNPRFFVRLMHYIEEAGYLKKLERFSEWEVIQDFKNAMECDETVLHSVLEEWKFANFYCAKLGSFLLGTESVLPYLFPAASSTEAEFSADKLYTNFTTNVGLLKNLTSMVSFLLEKSFKKGSSLKILEVGAGTGSATKNLIPLLEYYHTSYTFTDISPSFLSAAERILSKTKCITFEFCTFDVQNDARSQGLDNHDYDIIIAFNVLHATQDVQKVCTNLRKLLTAGGHLVIGEQFRPSAVVDIVFGHCEGYWKFEDTHRVTHCIIGLEGWENVLACAGFQSTKSLESKDVGMGVIVATNSVNQHSTIPTYNWLLVSSEECLIANALENVLPKHMGTHIDLNVTHTSNVVASTDLLIFCVPTENENLNEDHTRKHFPVLDSFLRLAQELIMRKKSCKVLVITHNEVNIADEEAIISAGSPVVALSRNLATEAINIHVTCLDLHDSENLDARITQILSELEKPTTKWNEEPIICYRDGQKYLATLVRLQMCKMSSISRKINLKQQLKLPSSRSIQDMVWEEAPLSVSELGRNQVEVRVHSSGLNFKDILNIMKPTAEFRDSHGVGADFSGTIVAIGSSVSRWAVGDGVIGMNPLPQPLPNYVTLNADFVARLPLNFSHSEGASLPTAFITAYHCLVSVGRLEEGETALIHTASGGVGLAAIQIAKSLGANIIVTAGSKRKRAYLRSLGLTHIYNSRDTSFAKGILELTAGKGVDLVLNSLTSKGWKEASLSVTKNGGKFIEMSKLNIWRVEEVYEQRPDVKYSIEDLSIIDAPRAIYLMERLNDWVENKKLKPLRVNIFSQEYITSALIELQTARHIGKVVVNLTGQIFNTRSTYLITGGLGGVGFEVAKWMLSSGAKNLFLVSRRGEGLAEATIEKLRDHNLDVSCVIIKSVDVGDKNQVTQLVTEISRSMSPLRGIIHASGVISDGTLLQQNMSKMETVYSAVSLLGGIGQGNYAAANAAVASLVTYRHRLGLPATCIAWGQWEELGMTANINRDIFGVQPFSIAAGLEALETIMKSNLGGTVAPTLWSDDARTGWFPNYLDLDQIEEIINHKTAVGQDDMNLTVMSLEDQIAAVVSKILRARGSLLKDVQLRDMGMDSLMFIELKNQLSSRFGFQDEIPEDSTTEDIIALVKTAQA